MIVTLNIEFSTNPPGDALVEVDAGPMEDGWPTMEDVYLLKYRLANAVDTWGSDIRLQHRNRKQIDAIDRRYENERREL